MDAMEALRLMRIERDELIAVLRYYRDECSGAEPSISVFQRMVDEVLAKVSA